MQSVVYADVLFFINFCMDYVSLYITMKLTHRKVGVLRFAAAAAVGAIYGVVQVCIDSPRVVSVISGIAASFAMTVITIGLRQSAGVYIRCSAILWGVGALLAGGVTLVCTLGNTSGMTALDSKGQSSMFVLALGCFIVVFIVRIFSSSPKSESCDAEFHIFGVNIKTRALVDSGNLVTEPISGLPVIFLRKKAVLRFYDGKDLEILSEGTAASLERLSPDTKRRVRIISVKRVGTTKLLCGLMSCEVLIGSGKNVKKGKGGKMKNERKSVKACVVIEDSEDYGGYDALVPASVLD